MVKRDRRAVDEQLARAGTSLAGEDVKQLVLALPLEVSLVRNASRSERVVPASAIRRQDRFLRQALSRMANEGYVALVLLSDPDQVEALQVRTQRNVPKERHPAL